MTREGDTGWRGGTAAAVGGRGRNRDLRPLADLAPFVRAHWPDALFSVVALLISTAATLAISIAARLVVDRGFTSRSAAGLDQSFLALIAVILVLALATASRFYFINRLGERVIADLRIALYRHVLELDQTRLAEVSSGEVLSRLTTDMTMAEAVVGATASIAMRNLLLVAGAAVMLVFVSPQLAMGVGLMTPLVLLPLALYGRRVRRLSSAAQARFAEAVAYAGETLDAADTVQAFNRERWAGDRFAAVVEAAFRVSLSRIGARGVMTALVIILVSGGVAAIFWFGAHAVVAGTMSGGTLLQFAILAVLAAGSVGTLSEVWGDIQKAAGAMERIGELLRAAPAIAAPPAPLPMPIPARGEIAMRGVVFAYPGREGAPALNGLDLIVRPGERVALVGPSGAGKSTVFRLLLRFYDPQAGVVAVDGVDLRRADPAQARARIALVAQDARLFTGSAWDNLRFGREDAQEADLLAAARAAQAEAFLAALPQGMATPLGERGKALSGGERQRLTIARALVRNAPILLLDEATSALDADNERLVQSALRAAMRGRSTLVIAHRLSTVLAADRIVVIDGGRNVEMGTHAELSGRGGLYARLARLQFGADAA